MSRLSYLLAAVALSLATADASAQSRFITGADLVRSLAQTAAESAAKLKDAFEVARKAQMTTDDTAAKIRRDIAQAESAIADPGTGPELAKTIAKQLEILRQQATEADTRAQQASATTEEARKKAEEAGAALGPEGPSQRSEAQARVEVLSQVGVQSARAGKELTAPGSAGGDAIVDSPSFVETIGLAVEQDLLGQKAGALTANLNAFGFIAIAQPAVLADQERYRRYETLRRFGGAVSIGGKGESFDQDGDGKPEAAKASENLLDIATAELRWRFWGTRDRRDAASIAAYSDAMEKISMEITALALPLEEQLRAMIETHDATATDPKERILVTCINGDRCLPDASVARVKAMAIDSKPLWARLAVLGFLYGEAAEAAMKEAIDAVDRQAIWSVVASTTRQKADFGPNRFGFGVRGLFATGRWDHVANADWNRAHWRGDIGESNSYKLTYGVSRLLSGDPFAESAPKLTFSVHGEWFHNWPGAKHNETLGAGIRLDFPFNEKISLPISLNYSNHSDLLTDQKLLSAHIGLAIDFSGLGKKQ